MPGYLHSNFEYTKRASRGVHVQVRGNKPVKQISLCGVMLRPSMAWFPKLAQFWATPIVAEVCVSKESTCQSCETRCMDYEIQASLLQPWR